MHDGIGQRQVALGAAQAPVPQQPLHRGDRGPDLCERFGIDYPAKYAHSKKAE